MWNSRFCHSAHCVEPKTGVAAGMKWHCGMSSHSVMTMSGTCGGVGSAATGEQQDEALEMLNDLRLSLKVTSSSMAMRMR